MPGVQGILPLPVGDEWFELEVNGVVRRVKIISCPRFRNFKEAQEHIDSLGYDMLEDAAVDSFRNTFATPLDYFKKIFFGGSPRNPEPEDSWKANGKVRIAFADGESCLGWYKGFGWDTWAFPDSCRWAVVAKENNESS